ncbi:MAG: YqeG family HAD IIIA-type phosphatase [Aulosira sp. ZfuCHP01]|nr:YqeG family HAD IIIA-type phosphatase [Aulosira sp. ZfuVER01]MDZ8001996.1 YqeG family HAD IIIA-type phosphatase [Aulosira sp. DedVER01a]MDZ8054926.1 YqeG family HAD IIIA-type phosphatase [Aulosira sp. ZfuCHP01]
MIRKRFFLIPLVQFLKRLFVLRSSSISYCFPKRSHNLANVDLALLIHSGIHGVILDLDNTIVSEDDRYLSPGAEEWIQQAKERGLKFFILSNGKRRYRVEFWSHRLGIPTISPARKPFPPSFKIALTKMQLSPTQVVVIGDSRHTDMLGAWLVGCPSIQVATLPHPFRWWEKLLGKRVQIPYPNHLELWDCDPYC